MQYIALNKTRVFPFSKKQVIIIMAGMMLAMFLASLDQTVVGTAMPKIIADLGGFAHYAWIATAYMIASTVVLPVAGKLTDMYGPKYSYLIGLALFTLGSVLCGLSQSMLQIIIFRALQGLGAGIIMANAFTVVADLFPPEQRGKYMGMTASVFGLSSIIGPTLGGYLTDSLSWHWVFFVNIPLAVVVLGLFVFFFPAFRHSDEQQKMDYPGLITLVTCVVPFLLALSWGGSQFGWTSWEIVGMLSLSLVSLGLFLFFEKKAAQPIIPLPIFRDKNISLSFIITFLTGIGMFGAIIFVPLYYQGIKGLSASSSGTYLMPMMLSMIVAALVAGGVTSKFGRGVKVLGLIGLLVMICGLFLMSRLSSQTGHLTSILYIVVTGFGLGMTLPIYLLLIQNSVPQEVIGSVSSLVGFARSIGGAVGLTVFGTMMNSLFSRNFAANLPAAVANSVPPQVLDAVGQNAQALVSPQVQAQLQANFDKMGFQGQALYGQLFETIRQALTSAMAEIFLASMAVVLVALIINFWLKEKSAARAAEQAALPLNAEMIAQEVRIEK